MSVPELQTYIVDTPEAWEELKNYVQFGNHTHLSFDLETNSANEHTALIWGIGLAFTDDIAFYIPIRSVKGELLWKESEIYEQIQKWCKSHKLIGWNVLYDVLVFEFNSGLVISDCIHSDGMLQKHTINEERPFGLKECAVEYLGPWADKAQERMKASVEANGGSTTKDNFEMYKADTDVLGEYCCYDTLLCRRLYDLFEARLHEENLHKFFYVDEVMPLYQVTINMKRHGFAVDVEYFNRLKAEITSDMEKLEQSIHGDLAGYVHEFNTDFLHKNYAISTKGSFPKYVAAYYGATLPQKDGKITLAQKALLTERSNQPGNPFYGWICENAALDPAVALECQLQWFQADEGRTHPFNLRSNDHLGWLLFNKLGLQVGKKTETGKPQIDDDYLESIKDQFEFIAKLLDYKKLNKLLGTYIEGLLERQIDGYIYSSMLQHGTTSGRYSSTNYNLQNLPRVKEEDSGLSELVIHYVNAIKKGFIAPKGYILLAADQSALEAKCFAHVSGERKLQDVFIKGLDLYSQIAIDVWGLYDCSADPKAPNFLKKKYPEKRQLAKVFVLAVVYGAEAGRISQAMKIDYMEAEEIIQSYLDAYPGLKAYMKRCDAEAKKNGIIRTEYGRIRHLPVAKALYSKYGERLLNKKWAKVNGLLDTRYKLKNALNNSKNFPIQGLAAHMINRAMVATQKQFEAQGIDGWISLMVHDEIICAVRPAQVEKAAHILKTCMETIVPLSVPLVAEPHIGHNLVETK